jgi:hypothetical protein
MPAEALLLGGREGGPPLIKLGMGALQAHFLQVEHEVLVEDLVHH